MGIRGLNALVSENAPKAIRSAEMKSFFGRKVAIDASMCLYQFLIAVRQQDGNALTNAEGETTSHLMGFFYRTIRMVNNGIKPCYVFDGKPPSMKGGELEKRKARRDEAEAKMAEAKEAGKEEDIQKYTRRTVRVTREQNEDVKRLLKLMGIPFVEAPCEAESQCAELAKKGKVYGAASEDMDTLCYQPPYLLRNMTAAESRKLKVDEYNSKEVLKGFDMPITQFVDMCILLGCDYCDTIRGVGPVTAEKLIRKYGDLEHIVAAIEEDEKSKYKVPENWPYKQARELFLHPEVKDGDEIDLKWVEPDEEALVQLMVKENGFSEQRIRDGCAKLRKGLKGGTQERLDSFFKVTGSHGSGKRVKEEKGKGKGKKKRRR